MLEELFGIQYTGSHNGLVYGYHLDGKGVASVHLITPTGNVPLGTTPVSFPHANSVRAYIVECGA